jgi:hypothetical protein
MIDTSPIDSILGVPIKLQETLLYYDGPRMFSATDEKGKVYLVNSVDEDIVGNTKLDVYLAAEINSDCKSFIPNQIYSQSGVIKVDITYDGLTGIVTQQDTICELVPEELVPISQEIFFLKNGVV